MTNPEELGTMHDVAAGLSDEDRVRIDSIKAQMLDAERGHELASLRKAKDLTQTQVAAAGS